MTGEEEKKKRTCDYKSRITKKLCGRTLYDHKHCIFHSQNIEGKKAEFKDAFDKEFKRQKKHGIKYDFSEFVFPDDISFKRVEFKKDVYFNYAQFSGEADFSFVRFSKKAGFREAQFSGRADFNGAQFSGEPNFIGAQFSREVSFGVAQFSIWAIFREAKFSGKAIFSDTKFAEKAYFSQAHFSKEATFNRTKFSKNTDFIETQFSGKADFERTQFSGKANFNRTQFSGKANFFEARFYKKADFNHAKFTGESTFYEIKYTNPDECNMRNTTFYDVYGLFEFIEKNKMKFKYSNKTEFLPDNFWLFLGEPTVVNYPLIAKKIRDDMYLLRFKEKHPKLHFLWCLFADCGRSILRWALWSILFAVIFAAIFYSAYQGNAASFRTVHVSETIPVFSFLYYSIVTFTTLGFGDIVPKTDWLQFWVMLEVILGYIMLGGLISILANKLARRS
ncbi:MAG: hypothetical protein GTO45_01560 [Candidatus Aminicenantes bacterium]|nr:hypothetical protein [Candidatus Aminicenantes bacterium]NIM77449.1 hypothetical protein [Candidatus Aminicenantes bacterium]NIN16753.1 hypothetical protein [Candidatus Aminicenantes bacterium]NIN40609.1 hypothetical protein [Candidatus Aminicenantes bacterium]NIN83430.1 hypothetical protein [Candidatus Aminicenantes bacterium]